MAFGRFPTPKSRRWFPLHKFDIKTEALQLPDQYVEGLRNTRLHRSFTFHDCLIDLGSSVHVVGLGCQQFLQDVFSAVGFEGPHLHLSESLSAELRLTSERLLRNQRVRTDGTCVNLVIHQMRQLQHIDVADGDLLLERDSRHTVVKTGLTRLRQICPFQHAFDFGLGRARKYRGRKPHRESLRRPSEVRLQDLTDVHSRWHAERIEDDLDRSAIRQIRHIFFRKNSRDHAFVAVTAGHLVADGQLALHRNIDFDQLDDTRRQFVAAPQFRNPLLVDLAQDVDLTRGHFLDFLNLIVRIGIVFELQFEQFAQREVFDDFGRHLRALGDDLSAGTLMDQLVCDNLAFEQRNQSLVPLVGKNPDLVAEILFQPRDFHILDELRALVLLGAFAGEDLHVDNDTLDPRRADERCVANIPGFFTEDGAQQFLFGRKLRLAFRSDFTDKHIARLHVSTDADDAGFVQILKEGLADVRNIASDFLGAEFRIPRLDLKFFDMDRRVIVVLDETL